MGGGRWGSLFEQFCNLRDLLCVMVICNQSRGMFFLIIFKSGPSFPLKIDNHSIQVYPFSALVQRLICSKTDGKASSQSNTVTEKHTQPNEANLCGINFLQKRKLLNFHSVFKKYLLILAVWDLSYGTWELFASVHGLSSCGTWV